ncbi:hypothetical protein M409DRAFT_71661 [Zasmidium cellare ATCC 36951]|uniref:Azaphilone pigments biosynthesis cluster protein L N-terminal domain-containing protein n=1 Tax=Zasmidium cellare ATCC 36951 TaxID=1080233 RepID=A0A6A6BUN7_ZASCE|nr:uncharacterized protein M409DRAFT_71661 [Zasmidium cellare ATCC 36951]KAF2158405.1 hypothetical protein M409DRAFT_71661 [Zasmidium cellare ATCC 36951]
MADPVSITASLLAITTAAIQSTKSLYEAVRRYRGRDKTLQRLQSELEDVIKILQSLNVAIATEESILALLKGPVQRCSQICHEFKLSMEKFDRTSKMSVLDWARMEFMRGDINEFIQTLAGYKSTISVGLGTITMHTSKVTQSDLELHLQRIDEKMTQLTTDHKTNHAMGVNLNDEKEVTRQCLNVCEEARTYLQNLSTGTASLLHEAPRDAGQDHFYEAQVQTRQALNETQDRLAQTSSDLSRRLHALVSDPASEHSEERMKLQSDIEISKQCLGVCNAASEVSRQKIYRVGEVIADGGSDQVVATTLADLFDVGKAVSKNNSAQLVAYLTDEGLRHLTEKRYSSRFGAVANISDSVEVSNTGPQSNSELGPAKRASPRATHSEHSTGLNPEKSKPSSNEMKKRSRLVTHSVASVDTSVSSPTE